MNLYTIYYDTIDYPNVYVSRRFEVLESEKDPIAREVFMIDDDLEKIREKLRLMGLFLIPRSEGDDLKIIETWL